MNIFLTLFYGNDDVNNGNEKYDDHDDDNVNAISIRFVIFFFLLLLLFNLLFLLIMKCLLVT